MKEPSAQLPPDWIYDGDPADAFDDILVEMDQIDQLDDDVQRLSRNALLLKCAAVGLLALILLLGGAALPWKLAVSGCIGAFWAADAFLTRRRRLETRLQRDILKGAPPAPDLQIRTLQNRYPERRMRWLACFTSREVLGFYSPFLLMSLLLAALHPGLS